MHKTVGCAVLWHLLSSVRREINFPANNFKHVFVFRTNRFICNESRCHILFLFCDAFSISLSEGIAQDLPAKNSLSVREGHLVAGTENSRGSAIQGLATWGAMPWTRVWILQWWMSSSKTVCSPLLGWFFQFIAKVMGWNSHFWKRERAGLPEALAKCPHMSPPMSTYFISC